MMRTTLLSPNSPISHLSHDLNVSQKWPDRQKNQTKTTKKTSLVYNIEFSGHSFRNSGLTFLDGGQESGILTTFILGLFLIRQIFKNTVPCHDAEVALDIPFHEIFICSVALHSPPLFGVFPLDSPHVKTYSLGNSFILVIDT